MFLKTGTQFWVKTLGMLKWHEVRDNASMKRYRFYRVGHYHIGSLGPGVQKRTNLWSWKSLICIINTVKHWDLCHFIAVVQYLFIQNENISPFPLTMRGNVDKLIHGWCSVVDQHLRHSSSPSSDPCHRLMSLI